MKILGHEFFGGKSAEQATTPVVTADPVADAQSRVDLIQNNLNTLTAGREMEAGSGTPNVDTTQIASLSAEKANLEAVGVTPTVAPVEPKARFANAPSPSQMNRFAKGETPDFKPTTLATNDELTVQMNKDLGVNTQPTPIRAEAPAEAPAQAVVSADPVKRAA